MQGDLVDRFPANAFGVESGDAVFSLAYSPALVSLHRRLLLPQPICRVLMSLRSISVGNLTTPSTQGDLVDRFPTNASGVESGDAVLSLAYSPALASLHRRPSHPCIAGALKKRPFGLHRRRCSWFARKKPFAEEEGDTFFSK